MRFLILVALLIPTAAAAQGQGTPGEQALGSKLMQEIQSGLNCSTALITAQADLAKAQAALKALQEKVEKPKE